MFAPEPLLYVRLRYLSPEFLNVEFTCKRLLFNFFTVEAVYYIKIGRNDAYEPIKYIVFLEEDMSIQILLKVKTQPVVNLQCLMTSGFRLGYAKEGISCIVDNGMTILSFLGRIKPWLMAKARH